MGDILATEADLLGMIKEVANLNIDNYISTSHDHQTVLKDNNFPLQNMHAIINYLA